MNAVLGPIVWLILTAIEIYFWIIIASAIMSWLIAFNIINTRNPFVASVWDTLVRLTEPVLAPIRRIMPNLGGIDISPIIVLLLLGFIQRLIINVAAMI